MGTIKRTLTKPEQRMIFELLSANLVDPHGDENGNVEYAEGWSDQKIADVVGCQPNNVSYIRVEAYGRLAPAAKTDTASQIGALATRLDILEHEMRALRATLEVERRELVNRIERNETALRNRVTV